MKIFGTVDGHPFRSSFMAMGDGSQKLAIKAEVGKLIGKEAGDTVAIHLVERIQQARTEAPERALSSGGSGI